MLQIYMWLSVTLVPTREPPTPPERLRRCPGTRCTVQPPSSLQTQGPVEANWARAGAGWCGLVRAVGILGLWDSESGRSCKSSEAVGLGVCWQEEDSLQGRSFVLRAPTRGSKEDPEGRPCTMSPHVSLNTKWLQHGESSRRPASF